jgi:hypothetical protein
MTGVIFDMNQIHQVHFPKEEKIIRKDIKDIPLVIGAFGASEGCTGIVERVDTPPTGGVFTKYIGCNYLYKGYPDVRIIEYIYPSKRVIAGLFPLVQNKPVRFLFGIAYLFYLLLPRQIKRKVIIGLLDYILGITHWIEYKNPYALPTESYCPAVKELHRVSELLLQDIKDNELLSRLRKVRDIFCMMIQMDTAYHFRFQDIIPEFDKEALKKNPIKEIERVLDIFIEREAVDGENQMTIKWQGLKKIVMFALHFKKIRKIIVRVLLEMDSDKIKFDEADFYFVCDRKDYQYCGIPYEERMRMAAAMDKKVGNKRPKIVFQQKI